MRILIVGGTSFVGRAIAWSAWREGHEVTVINRGRTPTDLPEQIERLTGDRCADLSALAGRNFDATVDSTAYRPSDVETLFAALADRGGHHLQISSVSAYTEPEWPGATEATATLWSEDGLDLATPITGESYGPLKAASERAAQRCFGERVTLVRPTYVIGSHDATLRFPYWVQRARRGGIIAVPGPRDSFLQYVDARDLADFVVRLVDHAEFGAFHVAGPYPADSLFMMMERIAAHVTPEAIVREVPAQRVLDAGFEDKFPLWSGPTNANASCVDNSLAGEHGLALRSLEESVDDVLAWWGDREWPDHWLTAHEETELLH